MTDEFRFGRKSEAELQGVHPELVAVVRRALVLSDVDFAVHDGIRTMAEQVEYLKHGTSMTLDSKHLPQADAFGHAVDLVPYINGKLRWEWKPLYAIAKAMRAAAQAGHVQLRWGGCWDRSLTGASESPEWLHRDYEDRMRDAGRRVFTDGPHFELITTNEGNNK